MVDAFRIAAKRGTAVGGALWTQRMEARLERRLSRLSHGGHRQGAGRPGRATANDLGAHDYSTTLTP